MKPKLLNRQEERDLIRRWQVEGDDRAREELIAAHIPLAHKIARRMKGYGLPHDDLVQQGIIGLMNTLRVFDLSKGLRFSTLARWYLRAAMQDFIFLNFNIVKHPNSAEMRVAFFKGERTRHFSLNEPAGASHFGEDKIDVIPDESLSPDEIVESIIDGERLEKRVREVLNNLPPRSADIIRRRIMNDDPEILAVIAADYGISRERVRQVMHAALKAVKAELIAEVDSDD